MRFLLKLAIKLALLVTLVVLLGGTLRNGSRYAMQFTGPPKEAGFSSEEDDLMSTVFQSALRMLSGSASRDELASELSDKLYSGRGDAGEMSELGIELVKPGAGSSAPKGSSSAHKGGAAAANTQPGKKLLAEQLARTGESLGERPSSFVRTDLLARIWDRSKVYSLELSLVPVVFFGMVLVQRIRRRRSRADEFVPQDLAILAPADSEPYDMQHAVHSLDAEDFEWLVALIYQRQGYRVSMPAARSGGRGGDFMLIRKAERLLVQCKKLDMEHNVSVERVRELHEAAAAAGATRSMYVASCRFTWDARNFAKAKGMTLINARTLDALITAARENPDEDLLAVSQWVPKLISKVQLTTPLCPACGAAMDELKVSNGGAWVCSQRPDCRGRRSARKYHKSVPAAERRTDLHQDGVNA